MLITNLKDWKKLRKSDAFHKKSTGFVPTMGHLHEGHKSFIKRSSDENDITIVSIFINPIQFNNPDDLANYPKSLASDQAIAYTAGASYIFAPEYPELYPDDYTYQISETQLSTMLEGEHRPGHFDGMLTVVLKLLLLTKPTRAYFGEKDFQQFLLIKGLAQAFFLDVNIIGCPIVRSESGLALSSRNSHFSEEQLNLAQQFPAQLNSNQSTSEIQKNLESLGFSVDYIQDHQNRRFGAVHLGNTRLIDNFKLNTP